MPGALRLPRVTHPLPSSLDPIDPVALREDAGLGHVDVLPEAESTMDRARALACDPAVAAPAVVVADRQTAGRGRRGAGWWQPPGSLVASLVLEAPAGSGPQPCWSLACGVALVETIHDLVAGVRAKLKWPNDVEVDGRKLAGILVETAAARRVVIGLGVNSAGSAAHAPPALRDRLVTLPDLTGRPLGRQPLLAAFIPRLVALVRALTTDPEELARRYRPLCGLTGTEVRLFAGTQVHAGRCRGIAADGGLIVDTAAGPTVIHAGSLSPPGTEWRSEERDD